MAKDYYAILEVKKTDSIDTIKKSYKKLALKFHPDKTSDNDKKKEYEEKFKEINEAYSILSDEGKRRNYDLGKTNQFNSRSNFGGGGFSDLFEGLFRNGSFGNESFGNQYEEESNLDLNYILTVKFEEAALGAEKEISIKKYVPCERCNKTGSEDNKFETCKKCNGKGRIEVRQRTFFGVINQVIKCDECSGKGKIPKNKCKECNGEGILNKNVKVKIKIPAGIDHGQTLRIVNEGNASKTESNGDLFLTIHVTPHKIFKRERFDVFIDLPITFSQAALGCKISVPTLHHKIEIKIPKGSESGSVLRLRDKGIPHINNPNYLGDQYVNIIVKTPKKLSNAQSKLFKELIKLDN